MDNTIRVLPSMLVLWYCFRSPTKEKKKTRVFTVEHTQVIIGYI